MKNLVQDQRTYFLEGRTLPVSERKRQLRRLKELLVSNEKKLADALYLDFKKSFYLTVENELSLPYGEIQVALRKLDRWNRPVRYRTNLVNFPAKSRVIPHPYGVSLVIAPWNYPYMLSLIPAISSLAAGNTVILKPSELTCHASRCLADLINSTFPRELFYVYEGGVEETTDLLKQKFDKIFFTGSTAVGKIVMKAAAENLVPVTLELGGKNPVIVLPGCNIKKTARRITWGKFHNNGQACVAPDHVYVHEEIKEKLLDEIGKNIRSIYSDNPAKSPVLPRIINREHFDRIIAWIQSGKVVLGGKYDPDDLYIEPTVLDQVQEQDPVMQEEVFGPVLPVLTYSDLDVLVERLKRKPFPVALYIFSGNTGKARDLMNRIPSGGGMINDTVLHFINMNTPFGGLGASGMGSYHGKAGFDAFSHYKTILSKPFWFDLFLKYPPYRKINLKVLRVFLGRSLRNIRY